MFQYAKVWKAISHFFACIFKQDKPPPSFPKHDNGEELSVDDALEQIQKARSVEVRPSFNDPLPNNVGPTKVYLDLLCTSNFTEEDAYEVSHNDTKLFETVFGQAVKNHSNTDLWTGILQPSSNKLVSDIPSSMNLKRTEGSFDGFSDVEDSICD